MADVIDNPDVKADAGGKDADDAERFKPFEDRIADLQEQLKIRDERERDLVQTIREQASAPRREEKAEPEPDLLKELVGDSAEVDAEKLIEALTKDPKTALARAGYVTRAQAAQLTITAAEKIADKKIAALEKKIAAERQAENAAREADAQLYRKIPELRDDDFMAEVGKEIMGRYGKDALSDPRVIELTSEVVKARRAGAAGGGEAKADTKPTVADRLAMQARGGPAPASKGSGEVDAVVAQARSIAERMANQGFNVKPEDVK